MFRNPFYLVESEQLQGTENPNLGAQKTESGPHDPSRHRHLVNPCKRVKMKISREETAKVNLGNQRTTRSIGRRLRQTRRMTYVTERVVVQREFTGNFPTL